MSKVSRAGVVAGSSCQQSEAVGQGTQPMTSLGIMILMVDLDAIQPVIIDQSLQHTRRQQMLTSPTPWMRDHREATRLVNQVNSMTQVDRVTRHMRRTSVSQEAVERLLSIPNVACRDQRVGDVRATDGGTVTHLSHDLPFPARPNHARHV